jgi:hypothetical protein
MKQQGLGTHRLVTLVATLVSKGLFVCPYKIAVPSEEETVAVNIHGLVHMNGNKVVKAGLSCGSP